MKTKIDANELVKGVDLGFEVESVTLRDAAHLLYNFMSMAETPELKKLIAKCDSLTATNCWWLEYRIGPAIKTVAESVLEDRGIALTKSHPEKE